MKSLIYGSMYGMGPGTLSKRLGCSVAQAIEWAESLRSKLLTRLVRLGLM